MSEVTISSKYQIVIPRDIRKQLKLRVGQKLRVVATGDIITMVPETPLAEMRGFLRGMDKDGVREDEERI
ncbi:MAG: AbrB/MazE/SpoVT family DNA-binding domain-containing protein [Syntrophomonadaceae bacterium]|nr:AbrB/MazE/SpoVT family DNA-binding domain-containing protein [Syntrophomonadaceae bacterium]